MEDSYLMGIERTPLEKLKEEQSKLLQKKAEYEEICRQIGDNQKKIDEMEALQNAIPRSFPKLVCLSRHAHPPTESNECYEAIWSRGTSCSGCEIDCYRKGWKSSEVNKDNRRRVKEKQDGSRK